MKLLVHGQLWEGGTTLQRTEALAMVSDVEVLHLDITNGQRHRTASLYSRVWWRLGRPVDTLDENRRLSAMVAQSAPDVVLVDNSKVLQRRNLADIKLSTRALLVYFTPDDVMSRHNLKQPLRKSFDVWDLFFTTKSFNVAELKAAGVRHPVLIGNSFDPVLHRPLSPAEVGDEFEAFDAVFVGFFEQERCASLNALAEAGLRILVHGASPGRFASDGARSMHPAIEMRAPAYGEDYIRALHCGKIALCFLRKMNRDRITTRSIELPAMARPMLAEKTDEHDQHFADGVEYVGFGSDSDLVAKARALLKDDARRNSIGQAGRRRCLTAGYSTTDRAVQMVDVMQAAIDARARTQ